MYPINFLTATPREVIQRSITCHPSLFRDSMLESRATHLKYSNFTQNSVAAKIAFDMGIACHEVVDMIDSENIDGIMADMRHWIPALTVACKLQCASQFAAEIADRGE